MEQQVGLEEKVARMAIYQKLDGAAVLQKRDQGVLFEYLIDTFGMSSDHDFEAASMLQRLAYELEDKAESKFAS